MTLCSRCATGTRLSLNFHTTLHLVERTKLNQLTVSDVSAPVGAGMFSANLITDELRQKLDQNSLLKCPKDIEFQRRERLK